MQQAEDNKLELQRNYFLRVCSASHSNLPKVAVLAGGIGCERSVSLESGAAVAQALKQAGLQANLFDIKEANLSVIDNFKADIFFLALHGRFGEDGGIQQMLEERGLLYTGSGASASRLSFDKMSAKKVIGDAKIPTPKAIELTARSNMEDVLRDIDDFGPIYVVKPTKEGSSVGVAIVEGSERAISKAKQTLREFGNCMIEDFVRGREITVSILDGKTLPIIEIRTKRDFYDYQAKYVDDNTEFLFCTIEDREVEAAIQGSALDCWKLVGCRDFARVDFLLDSENQLFFLEINTIPGLTSHSLMPKAAEKAGLSMAELCTAIVKSALYNRAGNIVR